MKSTTQYVTVACFDCYADEGYKYLKRNSTKETHRKVRENVSHGQSDSHRREVTNVYPLVRIDVVYLN